MAAKSKKVILFIVEGPTDESALSPVLKKIFQSEEVRFHVVHGDISSERLVGGTNAVEAVYEHIKAEMDRYGFRPADIIKTIHLIDTDGAFIPDDNIAQGNTQDTVYEESRIITECPQNIKERNAKKSRVLKLLYNHKSNTIGKIPYFVYYFSRNMEHVLYNISTDLTDKEKMDYADRFADIYRDRPENFIGFLSESDFVVQGNYPESWEFIFKGTNSLHRHCNLHLLFRKEAQTEGQPV